MKMKIAIKSKNQLIPIGILTVVPLIADFICTFFLPDRIPMHYNVKNVVDRWGSKYEIMLIPAIIILYTFILIIVTSLADKKEKEKQNINGNNNATIGYIMCILILLILNILNVIMLVLGFRQITNLDELHIKVVNLVFMLFGLLYIVIGNLSPKLKQNSYIGVRTKWTLSNEEVWKKSNHFFGITAIIAGVLMILLSVLLSNEVVVFVIVAATVLIHAVITIVYSYIAFKKHNK